MMVADVRRAGGLVEISDVLNSSCASPNVSSFKLAAALVASGTMFYPLEVS